MHFIYNKAKVSVDNRFYLISNDVINSNLNNRGSRI